MDKEFLLTYFDYIRGRYEFEWLDSEDEMIERIENLKYRVDILDAIEIRTVKSFY